MRLLRIKNYEKYQTHRKKNPDWIKLHRTILTDSAFLKLGHLSRYIYIGLLILASETDNRVVNDVPYLAHRLAIPATELDLSPLFSSGLLCASRRTLQRMTGASEREKRERREETERETEAEREGEKRKEIPTTPKLVVGPSVETWNAYELGFRKRYGIEPVRNAKTNSVLKQLVKRLGSEAPSVAEFYCTHNAALYVRAKHCVDLLLRDAEGLRMEWATGRQVTNVSAQQTDRTSTTGQIIRELIAEKELKHV